MVAKEQTEETFQFHKGTIKTNQGTFSFDTREQFQFHKGTIKTR